MQKKLLLIVPGVLILAVAGWAMNQGRTNTPVSASVEGIGIPRLLDLGATECIPCKMMAPILENLKEEYKGQFQVDFIDVWKNPKEAPKYGIKTIPTQIFFDTKGKELWRHVGFISREDILGKWKELGYEFKTTELPTIECWEPAKKETRNKDQICYMCDGDIHAKKLVTVKTDKGDVRLCNPHCYFIMWSCLTEDKADFEQKVTMTDWATGQRIPALEAVFLTGQDETTGRPWIKAFANRSAAIKERGVSGGNTVGLSVLKQQEMSHRCGFCDRSCYPQDAAEVIVDGGVQTWGCCSHCALGVAVRTGKDIEVRQPDGLTGEIIVVKTLNGQVASLEPATAVAWFGQRQRPDKTWGSAGCFHQGFFATPDHLKTWLDKHPLETGKLISIQQALADKMKLTPQQIQKACKIGECSPK
ncbi:MAG: thioredoxin fold domain-containing protein [Phycisphaerae bacterium]|nr:thioredoxin fold domain-containing protein [Phycisphaerae bacterium]